MYPLYTCIRVSTKCDASKDKSLKAKPAGNMNEIMQLYQLDFIMDHHSSIEAQVTQAAGCIIRVSMGYKCE